MKVISSGHNRKLIHKISIPFLCMYITQSKHNMKMELNAINRILEPLYAVLLFVDILTVRLNALHDPQGSYVAYF